MLRQLDVIFDLLVGDDASDEQEIGPAFFVEHFFQGRPPRRIGNPPCVDGDREHPGVGKAEVFQFLAVVLRIAQRHVGVAHQAFQVLAAEHRQPEDVGVVAGEEVRRRDVVILQHPARCQLRERAGHRRHQREVEDRQVAAVAPASVQSITSPRRSSSIVMA